MARLIPFIVPADNPQGGAFVIPEGESIAGRAPDCQLYLEDASVSRHHCRLLRRGDTVVLEDMGSTSGTAVNGGPAKGRVQLRHGDGIGFGGSNWIFQFGEQPDAETGKLPAEIPLGNRLVLGRGDDVDIKLTGTSVSRRHAEIWRTERGYRICDKSSAANSRVNGRLFSDTELVLGDHIQLGPHHFRFEGRHLRPVEGVKGFWIWGREIDYRVGSVRILDKAEMAGESREFIGILGPSGAGKTSLLKVLSGVASPQSGAVLIDGFNIRAHYEEVREMLGYVPQDDIVHARLTVRQALDFAARLRLPADCPRYEIGKLVEHTAKELQLEDRLETRVGNLSGGQRKRVNVGVELLARPRLLFLDEPTSGLDPATEFKLMTLLRELTRSGCTIVCTTHLMENVFLADKICVVHEGATIFQGSPRKAREHFGVDRLISLYDRIEEESREFWIESYNAGRPGETSCPGEPAASTGSRKTRRKRAWALPILLQRQWTILRSDWKNLGILLLQPVLIALLLGFLALNEDLIATKLFFGHIVAFWLGCNNAAQAIVNEIAIYRRERFVGLGRNSYLLSKYFFLGGITSLQTMVLYGIVYFIGSGLGGSLHWQIAGFLASALCGVGVGLLISSMARSNTQAVMLVPLILIPQILFSGFVIELEHWKEKPAIVETARVIPSFSSQRIIDTSLLWKEKITARTNWQPLTAVAYTNIDSDVGVEAGAEFENARPAFRALITLGVWALASYILALFFLRKRERG